MLLKLSKGNNMKSRNYLKETYETRVLWSHLAIKDLRSTFRGTYFGIIWYFIQQSVVFTTIAYIWSRIFGLDLQEFIVYIGVSFAIWAFLSNSIVQGSASLASTYNIYLNTRIPLVTAPARIVYLGFINLCMSMFLPILLASFFHSLSHNFGLFFIGLFETTIFLYLLSCTLAIIGLRYRDLTHLLQVVMQFLWIVTPVLYKKSQLTDLGMQWIAYVNPLHWMLDSMRSPIISSEKLTPLPYILIGIFAILLHVSNLVLYKHSGRKVLSHA